MPIGALLCSYILAHNPDLFGVVLLKFLNLAQLLVISHLFLHALKFSHLETISGEWQRLH